ncbi:MAG: integrase arm-type DNA-binding domain-containing protein [Spongiibacteraceae bacterium]|nr:integrase arm-type DNA-binding domain-containing protein [Spongiibacteraceae bacterium]
MKKGFFLLVKKTGAKYWRFKYRYAKKEKLLALGVYPETSLKSAREKLSEARTLLSKGIDPSAQKRAQKISQHEASSNSFEVVGREWLENKIKGKSESHQKRTFRVIEKDLFSTLAKQPVNSISPPTLLATLRKIENRGAVETAHRAKQIAGQIFRYACNRPSGT